MRKSPLTLLAAVAGAILIPSFARGQTQRVRFLDIPAANRVIRGRFTLRVSEDPILRPAGSGLVIRMDGDLLAEFGRTPCNLAWETEGIKDGKHLLQLILIERRGERAIEQVLDERTITLRNHSSAINLGDSVKSPGPGVPANIDAARTDTNLERGRSQLSNPTIAESVKRPVGMVPATLKALDATTLAVHGGRLYIGLSNGGFAIHNPAAGTTMAFDGLPGSGPTTALGTDCLTVWWITKRPPAAVQPTAQWDAQTPAASPGLALYSFHLANNTVAAIEIGGRANHLDARQIIPIRGRVVLSTGDDGCVVDLSTGDSADLDSILPREVVEARNHGAFLRYCSGDRGVFVAAITRATAASESDPTTAVNAWQYSGEEWSALGEAKLPTSIDRVAASSSSRELALLSPGRLTSYDLKGKDPVKSIALPAGIDVDGHAQMVSAGADAWWIQGRVVFHANLEKRTVEALFPWNEKGLQPRSIAQLPGDPSSAWLATNAGVRKVSLQAPGQNRGYSGFVRARLGEESAAASGTTEQKLASAIESWQGTPYLWGGESRSGVDCSGFVMAAFRDAGISLPHGSDNLRTCDAGMLVTDELRYGDVLIYPGHAAIYIGNGQTAETVGTGKHGVGKSVVWRRSDVVIRRFLNLVGSRSSLASRGGKRSGHTSPHTATGRSTTTGGRDSGSR